MRWYSMLAIYFLVWMFSLFLVLPFFGRRNDDDAVHERVAGQADGAPREFPISRVALRVTIVATALFLLFFVNYHFGWVTPRTLDLFGGTRDVR